MANEITTLVAAVMGYAFGIFTTLFLTRGHKRGHVYDMCREEANCITCSIEKK
jgi:hypothetical protein